MFKVPETILKEYSQEMQTIYGDNLVSVVLYGSSVSDEYDPKKSDLNFLIVLKDSSITELKKAKKAIEKWQKKKVAVPLVLDQEYIKSSLDTFPIEFLNMVRQYHMVYGEDILFSLKFEKEDIRLQCERELKGKSLRLRQSYLEAKKLRRDLGLVIHDSLTAFVAIFKALLYLKGKEIPADRAGVVAATCEDFGLNAETFEKLMQVRKGELKLKDEEMESLFEDYARQIRSLSDKVDKIKL